MSQKLFSLFPLTAPNLDQLITLGVIENARHNWSSIASRTGQADDLNELKLMFDDKKACQRVFIKWIIKGGHPPSYPLTWQGLYNLLCDVDLPGFADTLADRRKADGEVVRIANELADPEDLRPTGNPLISLLCALRWQNGQIKAPKIFVIE